MELTFSSLLQIKTATFRQSKTEIIFTKLEKAAIPESV